MKGYTVQDIMALRPCQPTDDKPNAGYSEDKLQRLFGNRQSVTLLEICDDERVPITDRQWVLHRLLPDQIVHEAACRYAERALDREQAAGREPNVRSWIGIEAKRMWLRGEISLDSLRSAARVAWTAAGAAARAADREAASAAAMAAASAAAMAADWAAAWDDAVRAADRAATEAAAWDVAQTAERRWQLATLREMIEDMEY